jgi:alkylation response protein AidB-like acyl-CoA dehydrogenase
MDFDLTEEQAMLADMAGRLFQNEHDPRSRRRRLAGEAPAESGLWASLADLGILGIHVPDTYGGTASSEQESAISSHIIAKAMGRMLVNEPFVSTAVVAASLIAHAASARQKEELLPKLAYGKLKIVLAHADGGKSTDLAHTETCASQVSDGYRLRGVKHRIPDSSSAHQFIISARTSGAMTDEHGISLFLVDRDCEGLTSRCDVGFDGSDVGELRLDDVLVSADRLIGSVDEGLRPMRRAIHRGISALLAEAVGAMERLQEMAIEHLKTRKQFGQPLARFQILQHYVADMATALEQSYSMSLMACSASAHDDDADGARSIAAAKHMVGRHGLVVGKHAVQLHGGVGMTDDLLVGQYFRRLIMIDAAWGNAEEQLGCFARTHID